MLVNNQYKHINPVIKILCLLIFMFFIWQSNDKFLLIYLLSLVFGLFLFSNLKIENIVHVLWPIRYFLIILILVLYYYKGIDSRIVSIKIIFSLIYWSLFYTSFTKFYLSLGLIKIIDFFNILNIDLKICYKNIYFICCGFDYFKYIIKDILLTLCLRGVDSCFITNLERSKILLNNKKLITESYKELLNESKKEYNYHYQSKNKFKINLKINVYDIIYLVAHLFVFFIYIWRIR